MTQAGRDPSTEARDRSRFLLTEAGEHRLARVAAFFSFLADLTGREGDRVDVSKTDLNELAAGLRDELRGVLDAAEYRPEVH